ncbi:MAG TPA: DNA alkylation repair protein [Candidatus Limnocylindrales bacterium]|nr:DNA alkylation repair protein [Candidatus Limnocylindrales bacterium]
MTTAVMDRATGVTTTRAQAFVAARRPVAEALGRDLAELAADPDAFAAALTGGLRELSDPEYLEGQRRVAPGIGAIYGVRWPLIQAVAQGFRQATRRERTSNWLFVADRLLHDEHLEPRWFAFGLLERLVADEPERTWQLLRRAASEAADWITVDSLAHPVAKGILLEPYRWAELEQLVFSPSRWERRLVGSAIATAPHVNRKLGRQPEVVEHGLSLIEQLIGDAEPDVQKALAWALRTLAQIDTPAATDWCRRQAAIASLNDDGHRAWVVRDSLSKLEAPDAATIRATLAGVRRRSGTPATSEAATVAARFGTLPEPGRHPRPPLEAGPTDWTIAVSQEPNR